MVKAWVIVTDEKIILDTMGKADVTPLCVRNRINKASEKLGLGVSAYVKNYRLYCDYKGSTYALHNATGGKLELPR